MLVGAHVSVSGGYGAALDYAQSVGCECIQVFAKSPRQWRGSAINQEAASAFIAERERRGFGPVFTHTSYLINLSTDKEELREKSIIALADEIVRAAAIRADGAVTHVGNDPAGDPAAAAFRAGESIVRAFDLAGDAGSSTRLLLENTAGAGATFGSSFSQMGMIVAESALAPDRLGVTMDTCHAFAFGYALDCAAGWDELVEEIDQSVGLDRFGAIHANDCMFERGSRRDRHAWIGDGFIGEEGFREMMCRSELAAVPALTEMPGEVPAKDSVNVDRLKSLRASCGE